MTGRPPARSARSFWGTSCGTHRVGRGKLGGRGYAPVRLRAVAAWWRTEDEPPPQSRIGAAQRPVEEEQARRVPVPRLPRPSGMTLVVVVAAVLVVGLPTLILFTAFKGVDGAFDGAGGGGGSGLGGGSHDGPSLIRPDRLERALARVRAEGGSEGSLVALRLEPERLTAVIRRGDGSRAVVNVHPDLDADVFPGGSGGDFGLSLRRLDPKVPNRIVRAAQERTGRRDEVGYIALASTPGHAGGGTWAVFFTDAGSDPPVTADLDGSNIRVPKR